MSVPSCDLLKIARVVFTLHIMKKASPSIAACLVFVASALVWIGGVSLALVYLLGLSETAGWWIAGSLGFSTVVAITVILYEMRHAVEVFPTRGGAELDSVMPWIMPSMRGKRVSKV